jgi:long-chain acyl-CoA synthetase
MNSKSLYEQLEEKLLKQPEKVVFKIKRGFVYSNWSGKQIINDVNKLSAYLMKSGVKKKDKVLIWAPNMPEWSILFLACIKSGIIIIPVDVRSKWKTVEKYIEQTSPKLIVLSQFTFPFAGKVKFKKAILENIFTHELPKIPETQGTKVHIVGKQQVAILFTSGSTGDPKGVIITQENIIFQIKQTNEILPPLERYETVSILPLSHAYELFYGLVIPLYKKGSITYLSRINPLTIKKALRRSRATYLMVVPQFLRIIYEGIKYEANIKNRLKIFNILINITPRFPMKIRRCIFKKIHKAFGGHLEFIGCGSAPLEPKLAKLWEAMGFIVIEGYGATETTGMATALNWKKRRFGTVGKPPKYTEIRLSDESEILINGKVVTPGYYKNKAKNKESFIDGWYKSGDIGRFDDEKNLIITGRLSTRIVMPDGTKIYPEDIERKLNNISGVRDSCVLGKKVGNDIYIHAYILPGNEKTVINLEKIIEITNSDLEFKQQITSYAYWQDKDFPRLRTLKVDRNKIEEYLGKKDGIKRIDTPETVITFSSVESILRTISNKQLISRSDKLEKDLKLDSLKRIQLAALIEDNLGVEVNEFNLTPLTTVKELIELVKKDKIKENGRYSVDTILEHWRFKPLIKKLRYYIQKSFIFPIHSSRVNIQIIKGKKILQKFPDQSLIIFNHVGMFEVLTVMRLLPYDVLRKSVLPATHQIWSEGNFILKNLVDITINTYPFVQRGEGISTSFEVTGELVNEGYSILFAPEGRMQKERKLQKFKDGLGFLIKELELPVVMFKIGNEYRDIWPPPPPGLDGINAKLQILPRGKGKVSVKIDLASVNLSLSYDELTKDIQGQFIKL